MAGRPKHRAAVAAALAAGEIPPKPARSRRQPITEERKRLHALVSTPSGFRSMRCTYVHDTGTTCTHAAVWGLDRCIRHGGLGKRGQTELRKRLGKMVEFIDPNFLLVRGHQILAADLGMIIDDAGSFLPVKDWPPEVWPAIASVKVLDYNANPADGKTEKVVEIRFQDQARYQELMMKRAGMLVDKLELSGSVQHEHTIGQVFADALREGLERAPERAALSPTSACPHCGKSLADSPAPSNRKDALAGTSRPFPVPSFFSTC